LYKGKQATRNPLRVNQTLLPYFFKVQQQHATPLKNPETKSTNHKLHNNWGTKEMLKNIVTNPKKEVNDKGWVL
jgi:hypothetical protein